MKLVKVGYDITGRMSPTTLEREVQGKILLHTTFVHVYNYSRNVRSI